MSNSNGSSRFLFAVILLLVLSGVSAAQRSKDSSGTSGTDFGPVMRAYLGYLSNEQEVVDDRASRREITSAYYRRNSNRIRALRQMAVHLVGQNGNDYVPELEAVTQDEFGTLFEQPPRPSTLRTSEIIANKFKFLATVNSGEVFYLFVRLDPYQQAELMKRLKDPVNFSAGTSDAANGQSVGQTGARPRRAGPK
jgi:hypothetical protein